MASAQIPQSPTSSKRSRSRDSAPSGANSSLNTPVATPSVSTNSLVIPSASSSPSNDETYVPDGTPYPAFLRLSPGGRYTRPLLWHRKTLADWDMQI
jgi:protein-tyrosine phosphatase